MTYAEAVREAKRRIISDALKKCGGNRIHAAKALGVSRTLIYNLMHRLGISIDPPERHTYTRGAVHGNEPKSRNRTRPVGGDHRSPALPHAHGQAIASGSGVGMKGST